METKQDTRLGTAPLGKLIVSMAIPSVAAQLINVLYNIVDRVYIGHIPDYGDMALTGVGVTFPIITLISAFSAFAGMGAAPLASIELGRRDYHRAEKILGTSTALLLGFSLSLMVLFLSIKTPVLYAFGATDNTILYAQQYITIYLLGTLFVQLALGLNPFISGQGNAKTAMLSVVIGAAINIALDPVLIFALHMGVRGAALATILSQAVSCLWVTRFLTSERSVIRIRRENIRFDRQTVKYIASLGISPFIMQSTESLVLITLNTGLKKYGGDLYVGSMSILSSVMQLVVVPVQGFNQGVQPIISYNYGAGNRDRVMGTFKRMLAVSLTASLVMAGSAICFPRAYAGLFTDKEALLDVTSQVMPVYFLGMTIFGIQMSCQSSFIALRQAKISLFIALLRKVILLIPLALILPRFFGVMGVYYAEPVADTISVTVTAILFTLTMKGLWQEERQRGPSL
jgi:putative MATE family efflux protein